MVWLDKHETELGREVTVMSILKKIMGSVVLLVVLFFAGSVPVTAASQAMQEHEPLWRFLLLSLGQKSAYVLLRWGKFEIRYV